MTSSPVTFFITSGPVMNMWLVSSTIKTKSVMAGEYTAPPAHGPTTTEIWGTTPGSQHVAVEDVGVAGQGDDALLNPRPARVVDADYGAPRGEGEVHDLADLLARTPRPSEPPKTVKSWLKTQTLRPETSP